MKALRAKRNSLHFLWKGSLVVISILALAFVLSCDNSSGSDQRLIIVDPGPVPVDFQVVRGPTEVSYQGVPPVLDGMLVRFTYSDGTAVTTGDVNQFFATIPGDDRPADYHRFELPDHMSQKVNVTHREIGRAHV